MLYTDNGTYILLLLLSHPARTNPCIVLILYFYWYLYIHFIVLKYWWFLFIYLFQVTCKVTNSVAGRVEFQLELDHFQSDGNAYSSLFPLTSSKEFAAHFNKSEAPQTPKGPTLCSMKASAQPEIHPVTPVTSKKTKIPCNTEGTEDFATPPKKKKQTIDEKIRQHKLGIIFLLFFFLLPFLSFQYTPIEMLFLK